MTRLTRRHLVATSAALPFVGIPRAGFAQTPEPSPLLRAELPSGGTAADGTWTFTDDLGTIHTADTTPVRIAAQVSIAAALHDYGIEPVAYFFRGLDEDGNPLPAAGNLPVQDIPQLDAGGEFDLELMIELGIDCLVGHNYGIAEGGIWPLSDAVLPQIRDLAPVIAIAFSDGADAQRTIESIRNVAIALGADVDTAENVAAADAFTANTETLRDALAAKPGMTALFMSGYADGFWISGLDTPDVLFFNKLGLDVVPDPAVGELSWEAFPGFEADVIFNDERVPTWWSVEQLTAEIPTYTSHPAVIAGQVYRWRTIYIPSYQGFVPVLEDAIRDITAASADIVQ